jgi:membrane protease YdiL (CAAX protease family)
MFVPGAATLVVELLFRKNDARGRLGLSLRPNRWFLAALLAPAGLAILATAASLMQPGVSLAADIGSSNLFASLSPDKIALAKQKLSALPIHPFWLALIAGSIAGLTINGVAALGEEIGWRGFLQDEWRDLGFWRSSWLIGLVWGLWHAPFILYGYNYPGHPVAGVFMMTLWTVLLGPLIGFARLKSGSVFAAAIMHGAINGTAGAPLLVLSGGNSLTRGVLGWPGLLVLAVLNTVLFWFKGSEPTAVHIPNSVEFR